MDIKPRVIRTIVERSINNHAKSSIDALPEKTRRFWFHIDPDADPLSDAEIAEIYIDEEVWIPRLKRHISLADFCLFGADYADWMLLLGREDLLRWQLKTIREHDMIPIAVYHWTSLTLPMLDELSIGAHWTLGNLEAMYLSTQEAVAAIQSATKPVTCFRILRGIKIPDEIDKAVQWLRFEVGAQSLVIGVDNVQQAGETFTIAHSIVNDEIC